jgi:hypothetical protein
MGSLPPEPSFGETGDTVTGQPAARNSPLS